MNRPTGQVTMGEIGGYAAAARAEQVSLIRAAHDGMSASYPATKSDNDIPLN